MSPVLGVVVVTFNSSDVILDCLESLLASTGVRLDIAVVDNASIDDTPGLIRRWAAGRYSYTPPPDLPFALETCDKPLAENEEGSFLAGRDLEHTLTLTVTGSNLGFAGGVNIGLASLARNPAAERFWILNPDGAVPPDSAAAFATHPAGDFSLMGGRVIYLETPDRIQIDGGLIDWRTGVTRNANQYAAPDVPPPDPARLDFITGASMVASRAFYEKAGPLPEDYFLYYEEVDWALRRGTRPLAYCPGGIVYHRAGTAIGSVAPGRPASPFSLFFMHRSRLRFIRRHRRRSLATAQIFSLAKAAKLASRGHMEEMRALLAGAFGGLPPASVRARLSPGLVRKLTDGQSG